jgi:hypothetical protein
MSEIESTLVTRVSDFVAAMNDVAQKTGTANSDVERNITAFKAMTGQTIGDLTQLAGQFDLHGRSLAEAVALIDTSNRRTEGTIGERRSSLEELVTMLDAKSNDLEQRLTRFNAVLDQSLEGAAERAREIARLTADSTTGGARAIDQSFETIHSRIEDQRKHMTETLRSMYDEATEQAHSMFSQATELAHSNFTQATDQAHSSFTQASEESNSMLSQAASRFANVLEGLKQMTSDMQRELEETRAELRKGILELPQETADSAAQMRRVIVDQIEALAELNRIVARHGRGIDAIEPAPRRVEAVDAGPARRPMPRDVSREMPRDIPREMPREAPREAARDIPRDEPPLTNGGPRSEPQRQRADITGLNAPVIPPRRAEAPSLSPGQGGPSAGGGGRTGWLSDLLTRASQETEQGPAPVGRGPAPPRESAPAPDTGGGHSIDSLDSLAVDIARMIDHDAAAELWDRYKRGERNVFTRKLYTMQGQKAFEEIRRKYRGDRDFQRTVDRYIGEFERLLEEVSRDDRGQVVARTYLTSETGKVYTMLAHAAGRFD